MKLVVGLGRQVGRNVVAQRDALCVVVGRTRAGYGENIVRCTQDDWLISKFATIRNA